MNTFFGRFRSKSASPLETELRAGRPQPPAQLVQKIVGTLDARQPRRSPAGWRLGFAGAFSVVLVAGLAATGGVVYAATTIVQAVTATHISQAAPVGQPQTSLASSACTQYSHAPVVTSIYPTAGYVGQRVYINGTHFRNISSVTFSPGIGASYTVVSPARIVATVPTGAQTGGITVTNCKGSSTSGTFTVYRQRICTVPNVVGMSINQATGSIHAHHCQVGNVVKQSRHDHNHPYVVYKQAPKPGTQLLPPGYVNIWARN